MDIYRALRDVDVFSLLQTTESPACAQALPGRCLVLRRVSSLVQACAFSLWQHGWQYHSNYGSL
jgi:hypothetical protein